jgi:DNA-binding MarR family transcriptional regulator
MRRKTTHTTSALGSGATAGFALWRAAMAWQRSVDRAVRHLELTHTRLLVLTGLDAACVRARDHAVSQAAIATEAGIDKVTVSTVVRALESRGLVDRDIGFGDDRAWRVMLTSKGRRALALAVPLVEKASSVLPRRGR